MATVIAEQVRSGADARAKWFVSGPAIVAYIACLEFPIHLPNPGGYGFFIDELYFMACGQHLSWGYVDMPPLTALQAWAARALFGDSILAIRIFPTFAAAGLVIIAGAIVRQLGGGRFAQALAAIAVLLAPFYLSFGSYLSMNSIEPLLWMGCAMIVIRMIQTGEVRLWLWFGVVAGIGLENKDTMLLFGFALVAGLTLTPERRLMASRWFVLGGLVALAIFMPNLVWQIQHHFPHLEMLANIRRSGRNVAIGPIGFIGWQLLGMQPLAAPIWLCGLYAFLFSDAVRPYRTLGCAYLLSLLLLLLTEGRFYYLAPAYPMLLAAGSVAIEKWTFSTRTPLAATGLHSCDRGHRRNHGAKRPAVTSSSRVHRIHPIHGVLGTKVRESQVECFAPTARRSVRMARDGRGNRKGLQRFAT